MACGLGDPKAELVALRAFSGRFLEAYGERFGVRLDCFDEGYMRVELLDSRGGELGSVYQVDGGRFALFVGTGNEEEESYFETPEEGLSLLALTPPFS